MAFVFSPCFLFVVSFPWQQFFVDLEHPVSPPESPPANHHYLASTARATLRWIFSDDSKSLKQMPFRESHFKEGNQGLNRKFATKKQNMAYSDLYIYIYTLCFCCLDGPC